MPSHKWAVLRAALLAKKVPTALDDDDGDMFVTTKTDEKGDFKSYTCVQTNTTIQVHNHKPKIDLAVISRQGIDNTGNIRTWPGEKLLATHMLTEAANIRPNVVYFELGAGADGVVGLLLHKRLKELGLQSRVLISDGNAQAAQRLDQNCLLNAKQCGTETGCAGPDSLQALEFKFGDELPPLPPDRELHMIAADVLFFEDYHLQLIDTLLHASKVTLVNATRGGSRERFLAKITQRADVSHRVHSEHQTKHFVLYIDEFRIDPTEATTEATKAE